MNDILSELLNGIDVEEEEKKSIDMVSAAVEEKVEEEKDVDDSEEITEEELEEVEKDVEEKTESSGIDSWTFPLSSIKDEKEIKEFDLQTYIYRRQTDPAGVKTNYFECFCKDSRNPNSWVPTNGLLSKRYIIANIENLTKELKKEVKVVGDPIIHHEPFFLNYSMKTETELKMFDTDESKFIFQLLTGIDELEIKKIKSIAQIMISNAYNGTKSIRVDYNIKSSTTINDNTYNFVDFFTLGKYNKRLTHLSGGLGVVSSGMEHIDDYVKKSKTVLKSVTSNMDTIISNIKSKLRRENKQVFSTFIDNLPNEYKNLFYVLMLTSLTLSRDFSPKEHFAISTYVEKLSRDW